MGSKQALSNGNEPEELTDLLVAFEKENQVWIEVKLSLMPLGTGSALAAVAVATNAHADPAVRARWASASAVLPAKEYKSLAGLLTGLLYRLDFEIGEAEMNAIGLKRA